MAAISLPIDRIAERVEQLLARHADLQQTHRQLAEENARLVRERDSLQSRLRASRARGDALLARLEAAHVAMPGLVVPAPAGAPLADDAQDTAATAAAREGARP
jgi:FtsZ-binding cell division protein ZapB